MAGTQTCETDEELIQEFGVLLGAAARLERLAARAFESECGISHQMFEVLLKLEMEEPEPTMGHLACHLILTSGGMSRLIDRMVAAGLVRRVPSPTDRRIQLAALTEAGREKLAHAKQVHTATLRRFFDGPLAAGERTAMCAALDRLNSNAREHLGNLG